MAVVTILEIFILKYAWPCTWPLKWAKIKYKYAWPLTWPLEWAKIKCKYAWPSTWPLESNVDIQLERPYVTYYWLIIAMIYKYVSFCEVFKVGICATLTLKFEMGQGQLQICQSKGHMRLYLFATIMPVLSATVFEVFAVEICTTLTFRMGQGRM